jgi:hypothetical protein
LEERELAFVWRVIGEVLDGLEGTPDYSLESPTAPDRGGAEPEDEDSAAMPVAIVGMAIQDTADVLVLRMLRQVLAPLGCDLETVPECESPMEVAEWVSEHAPRLVVVSHLPPDGLTLARYLVRRLRAQFAELPIVVGYWAGAGHSATAAERLVGAGATSVAFTLADARDRVMCLALPEYKPDALAAPLPA